MSELRYARVLAAVVLLILTACCCHGAAPMVISYQGRLADTSGGPVPDGNYEITFRLYTQQAGGTPLWTETRAVEVIGGVFCVLLGSIDALPAAAFQGATWLGTEVGSTVLAPRLQLVHTGYARRAAVAELVPNDSIITPRLADSAVTTAKLGTNSISVAKIQEGAVTSLALADASVTSTKIGADVVAGTKAAARASDCVFQVKEFGATGTGVADDTAAFQAALDAAGAAGGGVVLAPIGKYRIAGCLSIPSNVTLEGVSKAPPLKYGWAGAEDVTGTILLAYSGEGSESGTPFITLGPSSSGLKGLIIRYPNQRGDLPQPLAYPWTISAIDTYNSSVTDCVVVNPYKCLNIDGGGHHYVRGLYGQPLYRGMVVDNCIQACRVENVHFWPFLTAWLPEYQAINDWVLANGVSFVFRHCEWLYVTNTFCFGYNIGYRFEAGAGGSAHGSLIGIGADACSTCVHVESTSPRGVLITNGEFVANQQPTRIGLYMGPNAGDSVVRLNNCSYWGSCYRIASIESGNAFLTGCLFTSWASGQYAVTAVTGRVTVKDCHFLSSGSGVRVRSGVTSGVIMRNQGLSSLEIYNSIGSRCAIADNVP